MAKRSPIAIVGMAGIFPGAVDLSQFWQNVIHKVDAAVPVPDDRWIAPAAEVVAAEPRPDKAFHNRACLIRDFEFDPRGIDLPRDLLGGLDPMQRLVLHTGRDALATVRQNAESGEIPRERTGVILAAIALPTEASSTVTRSLFGPAILKDFADTTGAVAPHAAKDLAEEPHSDLGARVTALPAALLARGLGLGGGTYTLDAACASSLFSIKLACDELSSHRADIMLAGGVSRPDCLYTQIGFSQLRALSPSGRCAPFDESADGLVVGEGCGIIVLKRLADALRDGDEIHGIIRGIGLSNDIGGNLLAPDTEGQVRSMRRAYEAAGWAPGDVDLIECHGAGTPVGDAVELESLKQLWEGTDWSRGQCTIGSVKSMIGHLLTAAGAAGLIKTLFAMKAGVLPPTLHHRRAPAGSPLENGPFQVRTDPAPWPRREGNRSRRAAISAFGFGGINAHLLLEEWRDGEPAASVSVSTPAAPASETPVAVIGLATHIGPLATLRAFQESVFNGRPAFVRRPGHRWKGMDGMARDVLGGTCGSGAYIDDILMEIGRFHIPPNEIPDIIPQHLLMLKVAGDALEDAGLPLREKRPGMGAVIGMGFDMEATNFHLRWALPRAIVPDAAIAEPEFVEHLKDACSPPLTSSRTLGALGSMVGSRIAKEFRLGAPSFVVSCEEVSGVKALEIGVRAIQQGDVDTMLVGAVDMTGDLRHLALAKPYRRFTESERVASFDGDAAGTLPGEGAVALVLKSLDSALADGDRVYAVINGMGGASGKTDFKQPSEIACRLSLERCLRDAGIQRDEPPRVDLFELQGSGDPSEDAAEGDALNTALDCAGIPEIMGSSDLTAIGALAPVIGHTGAVAGLASVVKTCLCLHQEILPPVGKLTCPPRGKWPEGRFFFPAFPQYWVRNRTDGPRFACAGTMTRDGNSMHVLLAGSQPTETETATGALPVIPVLPEKRRPLGVKPTGLFTVPGPDTDALLAGLDRLTRHASKYREDTSLETVARDWYRDTAGQMSDTCAVSLVAETPADLNRFISHARDAVQSGTPRAMSRRGGVCYTPSPVGPTGKTAFVFPGSGNHYIGMGREIGVQWPEVLRAMDGRTERLKTQMIPGVYIPQRQQWEKGWEISAQDLVAADPLHMIFGQVIHGGVMADLVRRFDIQPGAVIGYSLGETVGNFALGAWPDRGVMLDRMRNTDLFATQLAGPCKSARKAWNIPSSQPVDWFVAVVNRPALAVREVMGRHPQVRLLIVNTPEECVIGGLKPAVMAAVTELACEAVYLEGVVTVHCDAAAPVAAAYRELHVFPTTPPKGIDFYSCAKGGRHHPTSDGAAQSILDQALHGFDFPATIRAAYEDGVRVFLEMGPHNSCSRMIQNILADKPHMAVSASVRGEDEHLSLLKFLATAISEGVPVDLAYLYGESAFAPAVLAPETVPGRHTVIRPVGDVIRVPEPPARGKAEKTSQPVDLPAIEPGPAAIHPIDTPSPMPDPAPPTPAPSAPFGNLVAPLEAQVAATVDAHEKFLKFSSDLTQTYAETFAYQMRLLEAGAGQNLAPPGASAPEISAPAPAAPPATGESTSPPAFSREMCMEFAVGSVEKVLGPMFAPVDTYAVRVRLPDEPLMLVDRILSIEGEKGVLGPGRIVTAHDVLPDAWYLDGDRAPVCISVEAGQADLFLCAYMGIDLKVKGTRAYRLLDATVDFFRGLPRPGDTIRYDIKIERFARQGETYLFFFHFDGYIGDQRLIRMRNGCAGFFTEEEVVNSGGIIFTEEDTRPQSGVTPPDWSPPVPMAAEAYDEAGVEALRRGDLAACFGPAFRDKQISPSLRLPGGRMKLIHRILGLDPDGGRYGLGHIRAEADIHPGDWFLTCHFVDDMVMPGTLMYECCAHTLRVFVQRLGWISDKADACYEPVVGIRSVLKCRGPVTRKTKKVIYELEIKELGYGPEPFALADAHMYADGQRIVWFKDMALKLTGVSREEIDALWRPAPSPVPDRRPVFDSPQVLAFAQGNPSDAFGEPYRKFDSGRFIARLPRPPYSFINRVVTAEPPPWELAPGGWATAEYHVPETAWYFTANRTPTLPFSILLEIALQPCGWLAAYAGSALKSEKELRFRNLGGRAELLRDVFPGGGTLTTRARMTKVAAAGDMIIEHFDFEVYHQGAVFYRGETNFGFFTVAALADQVGLGDPNLDAAKPHAAQPAVALPQTPPLTPSEAADIQTDYRLEMPAKALLMIDRIDAYDPTGGPAGLGYVRATKTVDPGEWFFTAHFYQDPVCPGSLGIESFLQLLRYVAIEKWPHLADTHRIEVATGAPHEWTYRGQVTPAATTVTVEALITAMTSDPAPTIRADGYLQVDGLYIYKMENFGVRLVPVDADREQ